MAYNFRERFAGLLPEGFWPSWMSQMPFTDFHQLDLDWILRAMKTVLDQMKYYFIDGGSKDTIEEVIADHPEWVTTVMDGSIGRVKLTTALLDEINFTRSVYNTGGLTAVLATASLGPFIGNRYTITETIDISSYDVGQQYKTISNCSFILESDMLTWGSGAHELPVFENCLFYGNGHAVVADNKYTSSGRFINCFFYNCAFSNNATRVQSVTFSNCRFAGRTDIIRTKNCNNIVFDNCQGESDFKARLVYADSEGANDPNCIDLLRVSNSVFEGNNLTPLIEGHNSCNIILDSDYFEAYTNGIVKANRGGVGFYIVMDVSNVKSYECGNPMFYIDNTYRYYDTYVRFCSCRFQNNTSKNLLNRYDFNRYELNNCLLENMTARDNAPVTSTQFTFQEVNGVIQTTLTLEPDSQYLITQARKTYTGFIMYGIVTDGSGFYTEKIIDNNNRWTITNDGNLVITITSNAYGGGRLIKL